MSDNDAEILGWIRVALLIARTRRRMFFRSKRKRWVFNGLASQTRVSNNTASLRANCNV